MTRKSISRRQFLAKSAAASAALLPGPFGRPARATTKSVVFILPGILGSELWLADPRQRLWIDLEQIGAGSLSNLSLKAPAKAVIAPGPIDLFDGYQQLKTRLEGSLDKDLFEVRYHAFDWRRDISELGREFSDKLTATGQPAHVVAHSMGGLVARAAVARDMPGRELIKRVIMVGTPNFGAFAPVQAMRGTLETLALLVQFDHNHDMSFYRRELFMTFPGLYDMLPASIKTGSLDFFDQTSWPADDFRPPKDQLEQARKVQAALYEGDDRFHLIAGVEEETVVAAQLADNEFKYTASLAGDGTVPLSCCLLAGVPTYYVPGHVDQKHMQLPAMPAVMQAIFDIIRVGRTDALPNRWAEPRKQITLTDRELRTQVSMVEPVARSARSMPQSERRRLLRNSYLETVPAAVRR